MDLTINHGPIQTESDPAAPDPHSWSCARREYPTPIRRTLDRWIRPVEQPLCSRRPDRTTRSGHPALARPPPLRHAHPRAPQLELAMVLTAPRPVEFEHAADYRHEIMARVDRVRFVDVPERRYLMIDGTDAPGSPSYTDAIGALYPVAYTLHFALKRRGIAAPIGTLEGLYTLDPRGATK